MVFGPAFNLETADATVTEAGTGVSAEWETVSPTEGTFTVAIPTACAGGGFFSSNGTIDILANGAAVIRVAAEGQGCRYYAAPSLLAYVIRAGGIVPGGLNMHGEGGSHNPPPCSTSALVGDSVADLPVVCGDKIRIMAFDAFHLYCPALTLTFTVTVLPPCVAS